uniref:CDAN1-interacting nuclease 1 n=1 Tax=viral metagenome TaxID=1070528 RepID=A0A6C0C9J5_9ZZZZ
MDRFKYDVEEQNEQKIFRITWINQPIPVRAYTKIKHLIMRSNDYSSVSDEERDVMKVILDKINSQYDANITVEQYVSIRSIIIKQKIIQNYHILKSKITKVVDEYNADVDIMDLSKKYDFPPTNLLKNILLKNGLDDKKVTAMFKNKYDPNLLLSDKDLKQYQCAEKNDANSVSNQKNSAKIAMDNEMLVVRFFKDLGIKCMTQDDLAAEQLKEYGKIIITPDILFIDPVYINGSRIYWMDYKNYVGTDVKFIYASNYEQAMRYNKKYGGGALCYHNSFVDNLMVPGTMILNADVLDVAYY